MVTTPMGMTEATEDLVAHLEGQLATAFHRHVLHPACQRFDPDNASHRKMASSSDYIVSALPHGVPCMILITRAMSADVMAIIPRRRPIRAIVDRAHFDREAYDGTLLYGYFAPSRKAITVLDAAYLAGRPVPASEDAMARCARAEAFLRRAFHPSSAGTPVISVHRFWDPAEVALTAVASGARGVLLYPARGPCTSLFICPRKAHPRPAEKTTEARDAAAVVVPRREFFAYRTGSPDVYSLVPVTRIPTDDRTGVLTLCVKTLRESRFMASCSDRVRIMCVMDGDSRKWRPEMLENSVTSA